MSNTTRAMQITETGFSSSKTQEVSSNSKSAITVVEHCLVTSSRTRPLDYKQLFQSLARCLFDLWLMWCLCAPIAIMLAVLATGEITWETVIGQANKILPDTCARQSASRKLLFSYYRKVVDRFPKALQEIILAIEKLVLVIWQAVCRNSKRLYHFAMMLVCVVKANSGMMVGYLHQSEKNTVEDVQVQEKSLMTQWDQSIAKKDVNAAIEIKAKLMNLSLTHRKALKALDCGYTAEEKVANHCCVAELRACHARHEQFVARCLVI